MALSSKCGFATLLDPHGGWPAWAGLGALKAIKPLRLGQPRSAAGPRSYNFRFCVKGLAMPIYAYRCTDCGHAKDVLQKMSDPLLHTCPACGAEAFTKQVTAAGFQLKGSGWYATDFKGSGAAPATGVAAKDQGKDKSTDQDGQSSSADKPASVDSKPSDATPSSAAASSAPAAPSSSAAAPTGS